MREGRQHSQDKIDDEAGDVGDVWVDDLKDCALRLGGAICTAEVSEPKISTEPLVIKQIWLPSNIDKASP